MLTGNTLKLGMQNGVKITWKLIKIIVPVYFLVVFLKHAGVVNVIAKLFAPVMGLFGLPGEAALAMVIGMLLNLYAAIGVIVTLSLTPEQITTIALMLLICHGLPVETVISSQSGVAGWKMIALRAGLAFGCGIIMNLVF